MGIILWQRRWKKFISQTEEKINDDDICWLYIYDKVSGLVNSSFPPKLIWWQNSDTPTEKSYDKLYIREKNSETEVYLFHVL